MTLPTPSSAVAQPPSAKRLRELAAVPLAPLPPPSEDMTTVEMRRWLAASEAQAERMRIYLQMREDMEMISPARGSRQSPRIRAERDSEQGEEEGRPTSSSEAAADGDDDLLDN
ncbi:hypothetical protein KEM52_004570 [Ascosphaera acerosa]|nr:hypothetical protein KEM52_004570 [Ascosphaera acerosa]